MYDVIIIGAGVSGCAIARELSRKQGKFLVVDRAEDVCCGTSKANSAICHAGFDAQAGTLMAKLNVLGSRKMPVLAKELDFPYQQIGALVVMTHEADRQKLEALYANGLANGVEGLQILERKALEQLEPHISKEAVAALYAPTSAIVCPFGLTYALAENAAQNGVTFQFDTLVTQIEKKEAGWRLETSRGPLDAKVVVNAAGVYADVLHNQVSQDVLSITPRRGSYYLLDRAASGHVRHTVFQLPGVMGKGVVVTPTVHGNTLVGPTALDVGDKDDVSVSREELQMLSDRCGLAIADIPLRQTITSFSGLRAHEAGHEFYIKEAAPGFVDCAGIESPGLSAAPAVGEMVAQLVKDILQLPQKEDFDPNRKGILNPAKLPVEQRAALIRENPAYGNVICRCESVTEGEILDAIHRIPGARSIDGIKRRTRAGMGRCQGGFCSPRVLEILARELGCSSEKITKSGGDSHLLVGKNKEGL